MSSIIVSVFILLSRHVKFDLRMIMIYLSGSILFRFLLTFIAIALLSYFGVGSLTRKLENFVDGGFDITSLRYPILMLIPLIISLINIKNINFKYNDSVSILYNFAIISAISIIVMVGVPLFADRIFMISLIIYGVYYYLFFYKRYKILAMCLAFMYFLFFLTERLNLVGGLPMGDYYWARYPINNFFLNLF